MFDNRLARTRITLRVSVCVLLTEGVPPTNLRGGNVFSRVCISVNHSVHGEGPM